MANDKKKNDKMDETKKYKVEGKKGKKSKNKKKNTKARKIIKITLLVILLAILITIGVMAGMIYGIAKEARLNVSELVLKYENSVVLDSEGNIIAVLSGDENREPVKLSEMSPYLRKAFVDIEDERFYEHSGVDVKRTVGATVKYALSKIGIGSANYGGSTITQQTIKNITEEDDRTWQRKVKEIARAYYVEQELSKDQILELYLNVIFMGGNTNIYGVEVASKYYFSKSAKDLSLAESAFLAGINNTPNSYNPFIEDNEAVLERIKNRTTTVLNKMKELGSVTNEEYEVAIAEVQEGLKFNKGTIVENVYSYHTDAAIQQIIKQIMEEKELNYDAAKLYLYGGGYTIHTTQDTKLQNAMNEEAQKSKYMNTKDGEASQAGMVLLDHKNGHVLAVMGGLGEKTTSMGFNRGTQAVKQTGSSMKPLAVLAPGINSGVITAATVYDDVPYKNYKNYNYFKGLLTIRYAIESSQNIPMLKAIQTIGTEKSLEFCKSLGFSHLDDEIDNQIGLALGGLRYGATPLEMAAAYGAIANDGVYIEPTFYTKVVDGDGNIVFEPHQETRTVMSSSAAYVVKEILTQPVKTGTATACAIPGMSVAAKTGTTNDDYDRWLCGFTPYYTAATWYGYDNSRTVSGWSLSPATQIWASIMKQAHTGSNTGGKTFAETRPANVTTATVCRDSGLLPNENCKDDPRGNRTYTEYFVKGTVPTKQCKTHVKVKICKQSGLLANEFCEDVEEQVFITRNPKDTGWHSAADAKYMLTITKECDIHKEAPDKTKPVIKLKGSSTITINVGDKFEDPGATATDDKDGDLTDKIKVSGTVNTNRVGPYTITYTVKDKAGNEASIKREVKVVKKDKPNSNTVNNTTNSTGNNNTGNNSAGNTGGSGIWGNNIAGNNTVNNTANTVNNNTVNNNTVNNNTVNNTNTNN